MFNLKTFSQSGDLYPKLDPRVSGGYTFWDDIPNANSYNIETYTEDGAGNSILLNTTNTQNNYFQFNSSFFQVPYAKFKIIALASNDEQFDYSDEIGCLAWGDLGNYELCHKTCNGVSYAYKMIISEHHWQNASAPNGVLIDPPILNVQSAFRFYDPVLAVAHPYWQAFTTTALNNLPLYHPYNLQGSWDPNANGFSYNYDRVDISQTLSPGPFYDKFNVQVINGWLIEKKMDQYNHFNGAYSPQSVIIQENDCANSLNGYGGWVWNINNHCSSTVSYPTVQNPFTNTIVHDLACAESNALTNSNPLDDNWNNWVLAQYDKVDYFGDVIANGNGNGVGNTNWQIVADEIVSFGELSNSNGGYITGISLKCINNAGNESVTFARPSNVEQLRLIDDFGDEMTAGLYKMAIYTSEGDVFPYYLDNVTSVDIPEDKEFLNLTIIPNPIADNTLRYELTSDKNMNCQVYIHDMNGQLINSEIIVISRSQPTYREIEISGTNNSVTQYIVSVICPDGSAEQEFALKL